MKLNDSEWTVMDARWNRSPGSGREILEQVEDQTGWACSPVKTILARLVEKGALGMGKRTNTSLYHPLVRRDSARQSALRSLLDKAFDGPSAPGCKTWLPRRGSPSGTGRSWPPCWCSSRAGEVGVEPGSPGRHSRRSVWRGWGSRPAWRNGSRPSRQIFP